MRCFIALDLDTDVRSALAECQQSLREALPLSRRAIKWVAPAAMHLTLKFLGDVPDAQVVGVCRVAEAVARRHDPFEAEVSGLGHFHGRCARVLWAGVTDPTETLSRLHRDLEMELEPLGWPPDGRRFQGHLTLGRTRNPKAGFDLARAYGPWAQTDFGIWPVETLTVFHSDLTPRGPIYTAMGRYRLGAERF